jgi:hypothetical protein
MYFQLKVLFFIVGLFLFAQMVDLHQLWDIEKNTELAQKACDKESNEEESESKIKLKEIDKYTQSAAFYLSSVRSQKQMVYSKEASFYSSVVLSALERPPQA